MHRGWPCPGAGVKNLLAGEQQAAVTVAVEALMDNKPEAEANFATLDPKVTAASFLQLPPCTLRRPLQNAASDHVRG